MSDASPLAADFAPVSAEAWRALVDKTLKGAAYESLGSRTADGTFVQPLYTAEIAAPPAEVRPAFSSDPDRPWEVRALATHPAPAEANREALEDLENGAASLLVPIDVSGQAGVAAGSRDALARVLDGVMLDLAPVALDAGFLGPQAAGWLADLAKGGPRAPLAFHLDPVSTFARTGASPGPIEAHVTAAAEAAARHAQTYPLATAFLASGRPAHEAGGAEGQELAMAAAAALLYAKAFSAAGAPLAEAFDRIVLGLSADADYFATIAKLRAARLIWAKLTAACGVQRPARIEVRSSRRMLSTLDAWTNLLRLTTAGFGAALGGADAVALEPFTAALGGGSALARRQARNIQLVLMEEAQLGRVADPAGGAWFLETLTDQFARDGWAALQEIERDGGLIGALKSGLMSRSVAETRDRQAAALSEGRAGLIGVTMFPDPEGAPPILTPNDAGAGAQLALDARLPGEDAQAPPLRPIRWSEPFEEVVHGR